MADIKEYLKKILSARYGKDVRQSIHDSIDSINNVAESYEETTKGYMDEAKAFKNEASKQADNAKSYSAAASSYASNAKTQADRAQTISESLDGTIQAMGTITFSELAEKKSTARAGYMWNISDSFTTTPDFKEGAGVSKGAGENVYMTKDDLWDCFAGKDVLSVNGKNGVVSLNAEDVPLTVSGTRYDKAQDVKSAVEYISSDVQNVATISDEASTNAATAKEAAEMANTTATATQDLISDEWESSSTYVPGDYCIYQNRLWKCLVQHSGQTPAEGTYWTLVRAAAEINSLNQSLETINNNLSGLGTASFKNFTTAVTSDSTDLVTSGAVASAIANTTNVQTLLNRGDAKIYKRDGRVDVYLFNITYASFKSYVAPVVKNNPPRAGVFSTPAVIYASAKQFTGYVFKSSSNVGVGYFYTGENAEQTPIDSATIYATFSYLV